MPQMKTHIKALRKGYKRVIQESENQQRAAEAIAACQCVLSLLKEDRNQIETFQAEDGPSVIYELLDAPCSEKVSPFL